MHEPSDNYTQLWNIFNECEQSHQSEHTKASKSCTFIPYTHDNEGTCDDSEVEHVEPFVFGVGKISLRFISLWNYFENALESKWTQSKVADNLNKRRHVRVSLIVFQIKTSGEANQNNIYHYESLKPVLRCDLCMN